MDDEQKQLRDFLQESIKGFNKQDWIEFTLLILNQTYSGFSVNDKQGVITKALLELK